MSLALNKIFVKSGLYRPILIEQLPIVLLVSPPSPILFIIVFAKTKFSSSELVSKIFHESSLLAYTSTGYNMLYGKQPQDTVTRSTIHLLPVISPRSLDKYVHILVFLPVLRFLSTLSFI